MLVKMLMEIDPLPMIGSMVMISPFRREFSPVEQLCQSARLVPPRGGGVPSRELPYDFFQDERPQIAEDGHRRATRGPRRQGAHPVGMGAPPTLLARVFLLIPKITFVKFQLIWSCA